MNDSINLFSNYILIKSIKVMMDKRANQVEMYAERTSTNKVESGGQLSTGDEISAYSNTPSTVDSILSNLPDHHHPPHNV